MEHIAVDVMGPLQETDSHNSYILFIQDYFTKWVEAYPMPNQEAFTIANIIVKEWVTVWGSYELHSDQGTSFESAIP